MISPVIPLITETQFSRLDEYGQSEYLRLYREQVCPCFEKWREPARIKMGYGGRGAGGKSESTAGLLIQFAEHPDYFGEKIRVLCLRRVQNTIEQSSKALLEKMIHKYRYTDFTVTRDYIKNNTNGSEFVFHGLNQLNDDNIKSFADFNIAYVEECASIDMKSWNTLEATIRKEWVYKGEKRQAEIWGVFNRETVHDPVFDKFCKSPENGWIITACRPMAEDNPWFPTVLIDAYEKLKETDPEEAEHVYGGLPRNAQDKTVWKYSDIEAARDRKADESGAVEIGVDVARYGKDCTVAFMRKGLKVIDKQKVNGYNTQEVAGMVWDMAGHDTGVLIKIDIGYNQGVYDLLAEWGANVVPVAFGGSAEDSDIYANAACEMMFKLPLDRLGIPSEYLSETLIEDITERQFYYNPSGKKQLEPKDAKGEQKGCFKARHGGRSPDEGDALCLCFYEKRCDEVF